MTPRQVLLIGFSVGICVSLAVLALLWFGVAGVLNIGRTDLMYIFWPSALMLTVGRRSTAHGIAITVVSVATNCLLYMSVAYGFYRIVLAVNKSLRS
jgi:hypothetical protein